ncbi:hypothetical protein SAMN06295937_101585 [Sphingopyxis flava]|uniref:Uncharacterized protein n=2 Tax=Sphingopyxis flava TaxID=1507287 RepID=A0A1T5DNI9_9SPHN|nr:hypothetical protein SAMN06295937_101585 [Sphingopyxis flava]
MKTMATRTRPPIPGACRKTQEAERLLARYPQLDAFELARLVAIFPDLPLIDKAVMTADEALSDKLAAFYRDHGDRLSVSSGLLSLLLVLPVAAAGAALWWLIG